ncbi:G-type lectin S-receptor-like serine/threonine-protein kinase B120 [Linum grandiflorum]
MTGDCNRIHFHILYSLLFLTLSCSAANQLNRGESLSDGETLLSVGDRFELGFFSPGISTSRYLAIWYNDAQENNSVIWVANRDRPILDRTGSLTFAQDGNLILTAGDGIAPAAPIWSSNGTAIDSSDTVALLTETGNLILSRNETLGDVDRAFWQSFENPTDTYLPNMRVLVDASLGENYVFRSWRSPNDPSFGNFTLGVDPRGAPQIVIWDELRRRRWRSGQWNGLIFTGVPSMTTLTNFQYGFKLTREEDGRLYFTYNPSNSTALLRFRIGYDGTEEQLRWNEGTRNWDVLQRQPEDECERYNACGEFGVCDELARPKCGCMEGFRPRDLGEWNRGNFSGGCVRNTPVECRRSSNETETGGDGFKAMRCAKLPDFADVLTGVSSDSCRERCLDDCDCNAYSVINGIGCMLWRGGLVDVQHFSGAGNIMNLKLAASELDDGKKLTTPAIVGIVLGGVVCLAIAIWLICRIKRKLKVLPASAASVSGPVLQNDLQLFDPTKSREYSTDLSGPADLVIESGRMSHADLPLMNINLVALATNHFSTENKLGQGGFGPVYKGTLPGGEEIAVKRLSRISGQGLEEFKNEISLIAKLQHRNLVRLLGYCVQGEEKMLIYEYMPNKSLDFFIFDSTKRATLDWGKRFAIIEGIARGLLYLHRDSRLRIIHRDLKASNILLDEEMNPKISDFGMARIFGGNQNEANTNRVVGTYGYMSPEYAMEGLFSVKSDVYSFGVLVLEIVSGRRNTSFRSSDHVNLISYAWDLWTEGTAIELVDPSVRESSNNDEELLRCIQLGMICVQDNPVQRPTMAAVMLILESDSPSLPMPRQPTFTSSMRASVDRDLYSEGQDLVSNELTATMVVGR